MFLFDCLKKDSLKTMARHAGSPTNAFRVLRDHFVPLNQSQIRVQEEKLKSLRIRSNENPATFFASMRETLGVLQMLEVKKDDREVYNLMLEGLSHEYKTLRETLVVFCPNDRSFIKAKVRERCLHNRVVRRRTVVLLWCPGLRGREARRTTTRRRLTPSLVRPRKEKTGQVF